jgi:hypothetical protein
MKGLTFKQLGFHLWTRVMVFIAAVFLLHSIVKLITLFLVSGSGIGEASRMFWLQLFSIQMIPTVLAYAVLAGVAYIQFIKAGRAIDLANKKDLEAARGKATVETFQNLTAYMSEYIARHNNDILAWISHKKDKGEHVPQTVENASTSIAGAMGALSEISFVLPYDKEAHDPMKYYELLRSKLDHASMTEQKAV